MEFFFRILCVVFLIVVQEVVSNIIDGENLVVGMNLAVDCRANAFQNLSLIGLSRKFREEIIDAATNLAAEVRSPY